MSQSNPSSRQQILARVREALSVPSVKHQPATGELPVVSSSPMAAKEFLPAVGDTFESRWELFCEISDRLKTETVLVNSLDAAVQRVAEMQQSHGWSQLAFHDDAMVQAIVNSMEIEKLDTTQAYSKFDLEKCDVGISGCDALIAQTGSVLVTNHSAGGRALSVLPHHHIAITTSDRLLATMTDGYALLKESYDDNWPSFISFITGPSRTADIERVLVLGAHGPKRLTVIVVHDSA